MLRFYQAYKEGDGFPSSPSTYKVSILMQRRVALVLQCGAVRFMQGLLERVDCMLVVQQFLIESFNFVNCLRMLRFVKGLALH